MTFEDWWRSDENRWSDTRYTKKIAEMAWNAAIQNEKEERVEICKSLMEEHVRNKRGG